MHNALSIIRTSLKTGGLHKKASSGGMAGKRAGRPAHLKRAAALHAHMQTESMQGNGTRRQARQPIRASTTRHEGEPAAGSSAMRYRHAFAYI